MDFSDFLPIQSSRRICRFLLFLLLRLLFELFGSLFFLWNIERNHGWLAVEKPWMSIFLGIIIIASPSASKFSPTEFWLRRSTQETQAPSGYGNSHTQMDGVVMSGVLRPIPCETWSLILQVLGGAVALVCLEPNWYWKSHGYTCTHKWRVWTMASLPGFFSLGPSFLSLTFSLSPEKRCFCGCGSAMNLINEQVSIAMWCHCRMVIGRFALEAAPKRGFPCYPRSEFWPMFTYITMVCIYIIHIHTSAAVSQSQNLKDLYQDQLVEEVWLVPDFCENWRNMHKPTLSIWINSYDSWSLVIFKVWEWSSQDTQDHCGSISTATSPSIVL